MAYSIRTYGDPVLKSKAAAITDVDGKLVRLVDDMFTTLYESDLGIALAAPQIGVQKQIFVWDLDGERQVIFNPEIVESDGEWVYDEGCLSIPGLYVEMLRPKTVLMRGVDINGDVVEREADELEARMYQHELDHLHGVLMFDRMQPDQRKEAMREYRRLQNDATAPKPAESLPSSASAVKLVYLGTPETAVPPLEALVAAGHEIPLVVTRVDKRRGRGSGTSPSPVKAAGHRLGLPVSHQVDDVLGVDAELGVVVAFGRIIEPHVLARLPMVNLHFSLLPRWRGAAPVERAILAGDEATGVGVMAVEEGLDTGGVYAEVKIPIGPSTTADELRDELVAVGTRLLVDTLAAGLGEPAEQTGTPTYAAKIDPAELRIDWSRPTSEIHRLIRVGGAWTTFRGERFKIHAAELVDGELVPTVVQPAGKPRMDAAAWRNGARPADGEWFE